ncbi:hypothetical protein GCM10027444_10100 [Actinopolyspora lacussalsi]
MADVVHVHQHLVVTSFLAGFRSEFGGGARAGEGTNRGSATHSRGTREETTAIHA